MKTAMIIGISGQDGSYLANFLIKKKYKIIGTTRKKKNLNNIKNHIKLNIHKKIKIIKLNFLNKRLLSETILKVKPQEIYFLSSISNINDSIKNTNATIDSINKGTLNFLEVIKKNNLKNKTKIFFAGSVECFGYHKDKKPLNENSKFRPKNPYAIAKTFSYNLVKYYREEFGLKCCTGILSNHESLLRNNSYVSKKIINYLNKYNPKVKKKLDLGNINVLKDWGWAPEFVIAFWSILNSKYIDDYLIATGQSVKLSQFLRYAFMKKNLNWKNHISINHKLIRKSETISNRYDIKKIKKYIGWKAKIKYKKIIDKMINNIYE
tara:strand:+ start:2660 stop:3625 length:966 start_codon:yes stop_codon:yes gene_type:complete